MNLKLYFLRHGETEYSQRGGYCGAIDPPLTASGQDMAVAFADAYAGLEWAAVYVSPLQRALATARPLCERIGIEPQVREGLSEIRYGIWENREPEAVKREFPDDYLRWQTEPAWNPPTGGETAVQVAARALPIITEIEMAHANGNVLIVSHKATIRILLCSLLGIDLGRYRDRIDAPAASLSVVKFDRYGPMLLTLGDRSFMSPELRDRVGT